MKDRQAWRGLGKLIGEAVEHGATAIERVHLGTAKRPFELLKQVPGIGDTVQGIQSVHDTVVSTSYETVRAVTRAVSRTVDVALDTLDAVYPGQTQEQEERAPVAPGGATDSRD